MKKSDSGSHNQRNSAEFDRFAKDYSSLIEDPIRSKFAPGSTFFFSRKWLLLQDFFARSGFDPHKSSWLDVGCGKGELLRLGKDAFSKIDGCDISANMLGECQGLNVVQQPAPDVLPYDDRCFDLVTAVCVFHHIPMENRYPLTLEIKRVLKPGGIFCIIEHNPWNPVTRLIVSRTPVDAEAQLLYASMASRLMLEVDLKIMETRYFLYFSEKYFMKFYALENWLSFMPFGGQYAVFGR